MLIQEKFSVKENIIEININITLYFAMVLFCALESCLLDIVVFYILNFTRNLYLGVI